MAILIERSITPVYANAMNVDTNLDGVVDGFVSSLDSGVTATFSLNDSAQKIDMTASTAVGEAKVKTDSYKTVSANTAYSLQVLTRGSITAGTPILQVKIEWYDSAYTLLSTSVATDTSITTYWKTIRFENITSPATAAYAHIVLAIKAQVAGDKGAVWFRNVMLEQSTICSTFATTTRAADSAYVDIAPLTGEWALAGVFALSYDSTAVSSANHIIVTLYQSDSYRAYLSYNFADDKLYFTKKVDTNYYPIGLSASFNRCKIHKFIISQNNSGMYMFIRPNNSATVQTSNTNTVLLPYTRLYVGSYDSTMNPIAFIESLTLYRNKAITTLAEADAIFDSMNAEMVVNGDFSNGSTGWVLTNGAVVENGMFKHVASAAGGITTIVGIQRIKVLPNNTYKIRARLIGYVNSQNYPMVNIEQWDIFIKEGIKFLQLVPTVADQVLEITFTTTANTYWLKMVPYSVGSGTFYWDDISVKLVN